MKKYFWIPLACYTLLFGCADKDERLFEDSPDERIAKAIAALKSDLVAPENGWRLEYRPQSSSGRFYTILDFNDDNTVTIKSDVVAEGYDFSEQTISYRIDSSLGLELILENYSFFSYLFEQNGASFPAEFEFDYVRKTDGNLIFASKTDVSDSTILVFQPANANDDDKIASELAVKLDTLSNDLDIFSNSAKITFMEEDLVLYLSMNAFERRINIHSAGRKDNSNFQLVDFTSPYILRGDSIVFDNTFNETIFGRAVRIDAIVLNEESVANEVICSTDLEIHSIAGTASNGETIMLSSSIVSGNGAEFTEVSDFYLSPIETIFQAGESMDSTIATDIKGALYMQIYFNRDFNNGKNNAIGFFILNEDRTRTFALWGFDYTLTGNKITFDFASEISVLESQQTEANLENVKKYIDFLTEGDNTYIYKYAEGIFELNNPCSNWSFIFYDGND